MKKVSFLFSSVLTLSVMGCSFEPKGISPTKGRSIEVKGDTFPSQVEIAKRVYSKWGSRTSRKIVILVDFSKPMEEERMYLVDLDSGKVILSTRVCHGVGSGKSSVPSKFSNIEGSKASSKGIMITGKAFYSSFGYSMAVDGLQKGINSEVRRREIIFHPSDKQKTPWSWGCFSSPSSKNKKIIDLTKNGSLVFCYSNEKDLKGI